MRFHIVGIGGAGMSAVAQLLLAAGHEVSGSDSSGEWPLAKLAASAGATVIARFDRANVAGADVVVRSSAYREDHPEVIAARAAGVPVWRRQDAWRLLAQGKRVVAIAGTHGKTTTTGLVFSALRAGGLDPSLLCGGELRDLGSNAYAGGGEFLVIEADEYDRAFLTLDPEVALVTNVEHDHVDVFPSAAEFEAAFGEFVGRVVRGGTLIGGFDDSGALRLLQRARELPGRTVVTYGTGVGADWRIADLSLESALTAFELRAPDGEPVPVHLRLLGAHNARNAAGAIAAADACGVPSGVAALALASFGGTKRRLEPLGEANGVRVVDDYAHHPTEIRASLEAVRPSVRGRLITVFQPHTPSRLRAFLPQFAEALRLADACVVVETFASAREQADEAHGARELARRAGATYAATNEDAARAVVAAARSGDVVLVLGAGDVREAGERVLALLARVRA